MIKRNGIQSIKSARSYTMAEAADQLGVSLSTIRNWTKAGLPILRAERPYLIQGALLKAWLKDRTESKKRPLKPEQMLCLRCKSPQTPLGGMVDSTSISTAKVQLTGLCPTCGGVIKRITTQRKLLDFAQFLDIKSSKARAP